MGPIRRVAVVVLAVLPLALAAAPARADGPLLGTDGKTAVTSTLSAAQRLRIFLPQHGIDQDNNGADDVVYAEILVPADASPVHRVPAIIDPSPYYSTLCRGSDSECIGDTDADGLNDKWPLFLDNYFVPRGYAVVLAEANGTGHSTGCVQHGGPGDVAGMASIVDWLNGRTDAYYASNGAPAVADWHNGKSAMIGKSYDGTLANAVAATGVQGLTTIVPESAISSWYDYSRVGGLRINTHYPRQLSTLVTNDGTKGAEFPNRRTTACSTALASLDGVDGDGDGDVNAFWQARDYLPGAPSVHASVFAVHGLVDDNVRMTHLAQWWSALRAADVPRKLWLMRTGHNDPFDVNRTQWVDTLQRWFDYWLYGVQNGIMSQPRVTIEDAPGVWNDYADWPVPGTHDVDAFLQGDTPSTAGALGLSTGGATDTLSWTDPSPVPSESGFMSTPDGQQANRRVFVSKPLTHDLRISGVPRISLGASLDKSQSNLGALLVDYGPATQVAHDDLLTATSTSSCWGQASGFPGDHSECYKDYVHQTTTVSQWRVAAGALDSSNRDSLVSGQAAPAVPGQEYTFRWPLIPQDYVFPAGHRIGVVLTATLSAYGFAGTRGATVTMDTRVSKLTLPVVGGYDAAAASGAFVAENVPPVLHDVPADISTTSAGRDGKAVTYTPPTATDDRDPSPAVACAPASGATFAIGTTTVTCTATDASGNTASRSFAVRVDYDGPPPVPDPVEAQPAAPADPPAESVPGVNAPVLGTPARFAIGALRLARTGTVRFDATLPGAGTVTAVATAARKRLGTASVRRSSAGVAHVRIVLTRTGRAWLRAHPRGAVRLAATYRPRSGRPSTLTATLKRTRATPRRPAPRTAGGEAIPY